MALRHSCPSGVEICIPKPRTRTVASGAFASAVPRLKRPSTGLRKLRSCPVGLKDARVPAAERTLDPGRDNKLMTDFSAGERGSANAPANSSLSPPELRCRRCGRDR